MTEQSPTAPRLRLGTRNSPLAMAQAVETRARLCAAHGWEEDAIELVPVLASGDKVLDRPLSDPRYGMPDSGFYWQVEREGAPALMSGSITSGGLDPSKVDELEAAFRKVSSFSGVTVSSNGETTSNAELFPAEDFYRAVRQATRDPEDPPQSDDGSAAFQKIRLAVKEIRRKVESNIESLNQAATLVQRNIELVRATGFALLDASQSVSGDKDAEVLALEIRGAVRSKARGNLSEAHNLNAILAAGLLAVSEKD
jgi:hypothetical protein